MAERWGSGCYSQGGASLRPKADHTFSGTTCQHQKFLSQPNVIALVPEGPTKGSPPRLIQADGSRWLGPPLTLLPNGEALQWPVRSPESFCLYAVTPILEASFFFFCEDPLKKIFYYKEFFSYWGLLCIVKAQITYHWWVLINTSSVIHTLITTHNVSLASKGFSGHFPVSPPPPPTPELTTALLSVI